MTVESQSLPGEGPFLSAAFLCEKVLQEVDGVKSAIRIVDRVTRTIQGQELPPEMPPFDWPGALFLRWKSGWARGTIPIRVVLVKPNLDSQELLNQPALFEGEEDRGVDWILNMRLQLEQVGIYWFDIYLEDHRVTRVPLRVIYQPQRVPSAI